MQAVKERRHALSSADIALIARVWSFPEIQTFAKANASKFALDDQIQ